MRTRYIKTKKIKTKKSLKKINIKFYVKFTLNLLFLLFLNKIYNVV